MPAQWKVRPLNAFSYSFIADCCWQTFLDGTGALWASGALAGKLVCTMTSTGTHAGNEMTAISMMSTFVHHGMLFVPLGYKNCFPELSDLTAPRGCGPWGAGTIAGADGSRQPTELELRVAQIQGKQFSDIFLRTDFSKPI